MSYKVMVIAVYYELKLWSQRDLGSNPDSGFSQLYVMG